MKIPRLLRRSTTAHITRSNPTIGRSLARRATRNGASDLAVEMLQWGLMDAINSLRTRRLQPLELIYNLRLPATTAAVDETTKWDDISSTIFSGRHLSAWPQTIRHYVLEKCNCKTSGGHGVNACSNATGATAWDLFIPLVSACESVLHDAHRDDTVHDSLQRLKELHNSVKKFIEDLREQEEILSGPSRGNELTYYRYAILVFEKLAIMSNNLLQSSDGASYPLFARDDLKQYDREGARNFRYPRLMRSGDFESILGSLYDIGFYYTADVMNRDIDTAREDIKAKLEKWPVPEGWTILALLKLGVELNAGVDSGGTRANEE